MIPCSIIKVIFLVVLVSKTLAEKRNETSGSAKEYKIPEPNDNNNTFADPQVSGNDPYPREEEDLLLSGQGPIAALLDNYRRKIAEKNGDPPGDWNPDGMKTAATSVDDRTELSKNGKVVGHLLQGDILPTQELMEELLQDADHQSNSQHRRVKRKLSTTVKRWSTTVQYRIDIRDKSYVSVIREAIRQWEADTCLRFRESHSGHGNYLRFFQGGGCYSHIGMTGSRQPISIGKGCNSKGIVMHEIGHALGMWHEQSRNARDKYVNILWDNMIRGVKYNFQTQPESKMEDFGVPYDLGSVMHYGPTGFSLRWNVNVIETKDPNYQNTLGQRHSAAFTDVKVINAAYCANKCRGRSLKCKKGGYPDPNNCSKCKCPSGFSGNRCERVAPSSHNCGGELIATQDWKTVHSPTTQPNQDCYWKIKSHNGGRVFLEIEQISYPDFYPTCQSFLEVKYGPNFEITGPRFCKTPPKKPLGWSPGTDIILIHHTDGQRRNFGGFRARFKAEPLGVPIVAPRTVKPTPRPTAQSTPEPTRKPNSRPTPSQRNCKSKVCLILDDATSKKDSRMGSLMKMMVKRYLKISSGNRDLCIGKLNRSRDIRILHDFTDAQDLDSILKKVSEVERSNRKAGKRFRKTKQLLVDSKGTLVVFAVDRRMNSVFTNEMRQLNVKGVRIVAVTLRTPRHARGWADEALSNPTAQDIVLASPPRC